MKLFKKIVFLLAGCGLMSSALLQAQEYLDNALYVKFKETSSVSAKKLQRDVVPIEALNLKIASRKADKFGLHREANSLQLFDNPVLDRTFRIQFDSTKDIEKIIRLLENDPNVEYVERIPIARTMAVTPSPKSIPDDPYYQKINGVEYQWYLKMINAEEAWSMQQGDSNIIAAIVDGAIWANHPELNIPVSRQYNAGTLTPGNSNPPYSNQDLTCTKLYASTPNEDDPCPPYSWSHGTHCAGVVGAKNNNGIGIASLASGVTLLAVAANLPQYPDNVVGGYEGIRWAAQKGAKVISCSWGSVGDGAIGDEILRSCYDQNIVIVAAAGNDSKDEMNMPASSPYVISVGSVDENQVRSNFSNYGAWVDIAAPGGTSEANNRYTGIISTTYCKSQSLRLRGISTFNDQYYDEMSGTSMATPLVASLCALMLSKDNTLTPIQIKNLLQNSATETPINRNFFTPLAGIINAGAALRAIDEAKFDAPVENLTITKNILDSVWFRWDPPVGNAHNLLGYRVYRNGTVLDSLTTATDCLDSLAPSGTVVYQVAALYEDDFFSVRKEARLSIPAFYTITLRWSPAAGGTVTGAGKYRENAVATISAQANEGYKFLRWTRNGKVVSERPDYSFRVTSNQIYAAIFSAETANENKGESLVEIIPNPVRNLLKVSSPVPVQRLRICDLQGRLLLEAEGGNNTETTLNVESLRAGNYVLLMETTEGTFSKKFVKL